MVLCQRFGMAGPPPTRDKKRTRTVAGPDVHEGPPAVEEDLPREEDHGLGGPPHDGDAVREGRDDGVGPA